MSVNLIDPAAGRILFSHSELECKTTGIVKLAEGFADRLVMLRLAYGKPMPVTSCCRSAERNAKVGGHPKSLHVYDRNAHGLDGTAAIDIAVNPSEAWSLAFVAMKEGWSVGVSSRGFVHLDRRDLAGLPRAMFGYGG
jgi:zinc D-Ala-D-Ala carboxypeptidase